MACKNIEEAEKKLEEWHTRGGNHFTSLLFNLIAKADPSNREALRKGFPHEVNVYEREQTNG